MVGESQAPEIKSLREFLKDPATRAEAKTQLMAFLKANPGLINNLKPILKDYIGSIAMHIAKTPILEAQKMGTGVKVAEKSVSGDKRFFANVAFEILENVNDHFQAINDVRELSGKKWAHEVSNEDYVKYFKEGIPQTTDMVNARTAMTAAEGKVRTLRKG